MIALALRGSALNAARLDMPFIVRAQATLSALRTHHVVLLAFATRLIWFALCPNQPVSDQLTYHRSAVELALGLGYIEPDGSPANLWPVGYPALLAAVYRLFGPNYAAAYALNILLSLFLVWGVAQLGTWLFGRESGVLAALVIALHPTFVMHTTMLASELPYITGAVWLFALLVQIARGEISLLWSVPLAGIAIGLLSYIRPTALTFVLILPLFGWLWRRLRLSVLGVSSLVIVLLAIAVLLPWGFRNQRVFGAFSLTSNNGGENLWMGNNPESSGDYMEFPRDVLPMRIVQRQRVLGARAIAFIEAHPLKYLALCAKRVGRTMRSDTIAVAWNDIGIRSSFGAGALLPFKVLCSLAHWTLLSLVALAWLARGRSHWRREDVALGFLIALLAAPFVLIVGGNRYMVPILPLLSIWAASGVWMLVSEAVLDQRELRA
ncbi:MAG TPA: hypothetical protein VGI70_10425 [Polyangiales bacterium]